MSTDAIAALNEAAKQQRQEGEAVKKVSAARGKLALDQDPRRCFFKIISLQMDCVPSWDVPTACTDGKRIRYNPEYIEKLDMANVIGLIPRGATMQMGIGGIPDTVYESLEGDLELGIHTEMISDGGMRAIQRGVVTGTHKTLHPGKVVLTFALGSEELYDFLDNNPLIEAHPVDHVNDPRVVAQIDNMVAVNSAIEVDLTGQVCSDSIGAYIFSGFGGQVDFIRGAAHSKGGRPIIALPSTAKGGEMSRIVPFLKEGAGVVTSRADVHYVVTEHGVANLFGKNLRERAEALIAISHPAFRDELERAAKDRRLLP